MRSQILQVNLRLKALAEIYTMHSFAHLYNHIFSKICEDLEEFEFEAVHRYGNLVDLEKC